MWDFFIKMEVNDDNTSQCKLCDEHVEMNELWSHLAKNHPEQHKLANDKDKTASADVVKPLKLEVCLC